MVHLFQLLVLVRPTGTAGAPAIAAYRVYNQPLGAAAGENLLKRFLVRSTVRTNPKKSLENNLARPSLKKRKKLCHMIGLFLIFYIHTYI
jgi:hypothetical protein